MPGASPGTVVTGIHDAEPHTAAQLGHHRQRHWVDSNLPGIETHTERCYMPASTYTQNGHLHSNMQLVPAVPGVACMLHMPVTPSSFRLPHRSAPLLAML